MVIEMVAERKGRRPRNAGNVCVAQGRLYWEGGVGVHLGNAGRAEGQRVKCQALGLLMMEVSYSKTWASCSLCYCLSSSSSMNPL